MTLKAGELAKSILGVFRTQFKKDWPEIRAYAEAEAKKMAQTLVQIEALRVKGKPESELSALLQMQRNAMRAVLLTIQGLGLLAVEQAINAALDVIRTAVNTALGFDLI